jgi:hypothetical protein
LPDSGDEQCEYSGGCAEQGRGDDENDERWRHRASSFFLRAEIVAISLISARTAGAWAEVAAVRVRLMAEWRPDRLMSTAEAERGGKRVSEGVSGDWAAVAHAIDDRVRELGWRQRELAERSHVSAAVVREIQRHTVERRRSPRTLESLSAALGWKPGHLAGVLTGNAAQQGNRNRVPVDAAALWSRLESLEGRLDEIAKLVSDLKTDIATLIEIARRER